MLQRWRPRSKVEARTFVGMLVLLSPAKDLAQETPVVLNATQPVLLKHAIPLVDSLKGLGTARLCELMGLSPKLGELNRQRYQDWSTPFTPKNARPAVFAFNGEVYRGLDARSLPPEDLVFAQHHLRILSGLYGVLRPLDLMQDYRLMMGTPFGVGKAKDLYAYWRTRITEALTADLAKSGSEVIIDLASGEYSRAVDFEKLGASVITPEFKDRVGGGYRSLQVYLKRQRGAMARFIIRHRILDAAGIQGYDLDGYRYVAEESTAAKWVFLREKRPALVRRSLAGGRIR